MGPSNDPQQNRPIDPESARLRQVAASQGLSGTKLLAEHYGEDFLKGLRQFFEVRLSREFVSPQKYRSLHPEITEEMAVGAAAELNLLLLFNRYRQVTGARGSIGISDLRQLVNGTSTASREALSAAATALGIPVAEIENESWGLAYRQETEL